MPLFRACRGPGGPDATAVDVQILSVVPQGNGDPLQDASRHRRLYRRHRPFDLPRWVGLGDARLGRVADGVYEQPVVPPDPAMLARRTGKQILDAVPVGIEQFVAAVEHAGWVVPRQGVGRGVESRDAVGVKHASGGSVHGAGVDGLTARSGGVGEHGGSGTVPG